MHCRVTILANVAGDRVAQRLAGCGQVVVAAQAAAVEAGMIEPREPPVLNRVAGRAIQRGRNVELALALGHEVVVTSFAATRGAAKDACAMALLTVDGLVRALKRKAGCEMVEAIDDALFVLVLRCGDRHTKAEDEEDQGRFE